MNSSNVLRISSRLCLNAVNKSLARPLSSMATRYNLINSNQLLKSNAFVFVNSINKQTSFVRCYASDSKLNKEQVEEKVLDILRNFDRVKENPSKPQVSLLVEFHVYSQLLI